MGLLALALLCGCSAEKPAPPADQPHNVTLTAAQRQRISLYAMAPLSFQPVLEANGVVDYDNDQATSVTAPFSGPVVRLPVEPGQFVRRGQVLAVVVSADYASAVGAYQKAVVAAQNARRIADSDKDLAQHNGIPAREAQQAQTDAAGAEADREAAFRGLAALGADPRHVGAGGGARMLASIRAPISGTLVERLITPGQLLQAGATPSFTIADLSRVWVLAQIPPSDLGSVHIGDRATVDTGSGSVLTGTVTNISQLVNPDTRTFTARISVDNRGGVLRKQMYVRVRLQAARQATGLLAPVSAVLRDDENLPFVYAAEPDGSFIRRHVTLGARTGDFYVIATGLKPGDKVVAQGAIFLQFMQTQ
jgi:cobalt-zinc-cadmium efflux system membrane fusion protein